MQKLGLPVAVGRAGGACQGDITADFVCRFSFATLVSPLLLVAGAASAQAQKRVRHSDVGDVGNIEREGLPIPVPAPVPAGAGVGQSAAVVAPLVGHSSPSLDGTESKLDDPSAAAVRDGGAMASTSDSMEDVVVLEPEAAAAGAAGAPVAWTVPQALGVVTVARDQLIRTLSRRGGLPLEDDSCVVFHDGAPFYKCGVCKVHVPLASGRGALVEHFTSSKHLRNCSLRAVTQRLGMRAQGGGNRPKVGPSTGALLTPAPPTHPALGAPAALPSAPGVPPAVVSVAASAGADVTQVGTDGSGPGGSSAGGSAAPGAAPAGNGEAGVAAFALQQSSFLHDLSITDANEQRWWRWHAEWTRSWSCSSLGWLPLTVNTGVGRRGSRRMHLSPSGPQGLRKVRSVGCAYSWLTFVYKMLPSVLMMVMVLAGALSSQFPSPV